MRYLNYPVDREMELVESEKLVTLKFISQQDPIFIEHFPGFSIYPGSMIMNSVIVTLELLLSYSGLAHLTRDKIIFKNVKFKNMCLPGDAIKTEVAFLDGDQLKFQVKGYFANSVLCTGRILIRNEVSDE